MFATPRRLPALALMGLLFCAVLAGCDSPEERASDFTSRGKALYESGDEVKAALEFRNALKANPVAAEPAWYLAKIAEKAGDLQGAFGYYTAVADQDPRNADAQLAAGRLALLFGRTDDTVYRADKLITLTPEKADGYLLKAAAEIARNKPPAAETLLQKVLTLDADNVDAIGMLAEIRARRQDYEAALQLLNRGLTIAPQNVELLGAKLALAKLRHNDDEAVALLRRLHAARPKDPGYVDELAMALLATGREDEAKSTYEAAIRAGGANRAMTVRYAAFLEQNFGIQSALAGVAGLPDTAMPKAQKLQFLGQMAVKAGDLAAAERSFQELGAEGGDLANQSNAQTGLAQVALLRGDITKARASVEAVLAKDPGNEPGLLVRGAISSAEQQFDAAIADARTVLRTDPDSAPAFSLLARTYLAMGDRTMAAQSLRDLIRVDQSDAQARLDLAGLLANTAPGEAISLLDQAIALRPNAPELRAQKALYLLHLGERDKAEIIGGELASKDKDNAALGNQVLAEVAMARADFTTAIDRFQDAIKEGGSFTTLGPKLTQAYVNLGRTADAEVMLKDRIHQHPDEAASYLLLASIRRHAGALDEADALLMQAIESRPSDPASYVAMSQSMMAQGYAADAARLMQIAADRFPESENVQAISAAAADSLGNFPAAQAGYEKVLAKWPENALAANNLAALIADVSATDSPQLTRARQLAERFRGSNNPQQLDTLGWVLLRQGEVQDATVVLAKAVDLAPHNQQILYHYAVSLSQKGLKDKARATVARAISDSPTYRGIEDARQLADSLQ